MENYQENNNKPEAKYFNLNSEDLFKEYKEIEQELAKAKDESEKQFLRQEDRDEAEARYHELENDFNIIKSAIESKMKNN